MKSLLSLTVAALAALLLLAGCPADSNKVPKPPPTVPEPKAAMGSAPTVPQALHAHARTQA
jgi:uncharacterized lipoprotein YajG